MEREDLIEEMRWQPVQYGFTSIHDFVSRQNRPWRTEGTRNHQMTDRGLRREERQSGAIEVTEHNLDLFQRIIAGRTVIGVEREPDESEWNDGQNSVIITLDDGSRLLFCGWGYDASGLTTEYEPPKNDDV